MVRDSVASMTIVFGYKVARMGEEKKEKVFKSCSVLPRCDLILVILSTNRVTAPSAVTLSRWLLWQLNARFSIHLTIRPWSIFCLFFVLLHKLGPHL